MGRLASDMSLKMAREVLGVSSICTPEEVRLAFRAAAKRAHPDGGGDEAAFRQVVNAYKRLQASDEPAYAPPELAAARPACTTLDVSPLLALNGGETSHALPDGRTVRIALPPGLRSGDRVRAGGHTFKVYIRAEGGVLARGDDLWMSVRVSAATLRKGGRIAVDTPLGRRTVWITRKAAERGLVRLEGQGLPARGRHAKGHLFLRLSAETARADSAALALLRRFASAWAV